MFGHRLVFCRQETSVRSCQDDQVGQECFRNFWSADSNSRYFPRRFRFVNFAPHNTFLNSRHVRSGARLSHAAHSRREWFSRAATDANVARGLRLQGVQAWRIVAASRRSAAKKWPPGENRYDTSVPTFSPSTTRLRLCSLKKSKTMIGILLSMQSENAVESITFSCRCSASR